MKKRGVYVLVAFLLVVLFVLATHTITITNPPSSNSNITGNVNISINIDSGQTNITNVTFQILNASNSIFNLGINSSNNLTGYTFNWPTNNGTFPEAHANYTVNVIVTNANASGSTLDTIVANFTNITVDNSVPRAITLNSLANDTNTSSTSITFNWTSEDSVDPVLLCNLTINGLVNVTDVSSNNGTATTSTVNSFADGRHTWNVTCTDDVGNQNNSVTNRFTVSTGVPTVTLNAPVNNSFLSSSVVGFNFTVQSNLFSTIASCNVTLDPNNSTSGFIVNTTTNVVNNTATTLNGRVDEGTHSWNAFCTDSASTTGRSVNRTFTLDSSAPAVTITFEDDDANSKTTFGATDKVKVICEREENGTAYNNTVISVQFPGISSFIEELRITDEGTVKQQQSVTLTEAETEEVGDYAVKCDVTNKAGSTNSTNKTFNVEKKVRTGGGGFSVRGFSPPVGNVKIKEGFKKMSLEEGEIVSYLIGKDAGVQFIINGAEHTIKVLRLSDERLTIEVRSEPKEYTLDKGESVVVDINDDKRTDLTVTYHKIFQNTADMSFELGEKIMEGKEDRGSEQGIQQPIEVSEKKTTQKPLTGVLVMIIIISVVLVIGYVIITRK